MRIENVPTQGNSRKVPKLSVLTFNQVDSGAFDGGRHSSDVVFDDVDVGVGGDVERDDVVDDGGVLLLRNPEPLRHALRQGRG